VAGFAVAMYFKTRPFRNGTYSELWGGSGMRGTPRDGAEETDPSDLGD
jgi:hypothetical protein